MVTVFQFLCLGAVACGLLLGRPAWPWASRCASYRACGRMCVCPLHAPSLGASEVFLLLVQLMAILPGASSGPSKGNASANLPEAIERVFSSPRRHWFLRISTEHSRFTHITLFLVLPLCWAEGQLSDSQAARGLKESLMFQVDPPGERRANPITSSWHLANAKIKAPWHLVSKCLAGMPLNWWGDDYVLSRIWLFMSPWTVPTRLPCHGILQARILERVAISSSRESSWRRDRTCVSCVAGRFFTIWATRFAPYAGRACLSPTGGTWTNPIAFCGTYANSASAINLGFTSEVLV